MLQMLALSATVPERDLGGAEHGPVAAQAMLGRLFPGRSYRHVRSASHGEGWGPVDVAISTYGESVLMLGPSADELDVPDGLGVFEFAYQTVSDAAHIHVSAPGRWERTLEIWDGMAQEEVELLVSGEPLPFEEPFWREAYPDGPDGPLELDTVGFVAEATAWMFGFDPLQWDRTGTRVADLPVHLFDEIVPTAPSETPPTAARTSGWWRRLRGR